MARFKSSFKALSCKCGTKQNAKQPDRHYCGSSFRLLTFGFNGINLKFCRDALIHLTGAVTDSPHTVHCTVFSEKTYIVICRTAFKALRWEKKTHNMAFKDDYAWI